MFTVGARYQFRMLEDGDEVSFSGVVESYEPPLIKLADSAPLQVRRSIQETGETVKTTDVPRHPGRIINTASPNFISALQRA
ncbi:hypothetical protein RQ479_21270 [Mesorhizobium sp. ISC25]|uniref:hypothetical protein n=1 Tax=Mesorhizobium sp. ISC25 TaxID=3077335 RepID=UPI0035DDD948